MKWSGASPPLRALSNVAKALALSLSTLQRGDGSSSVHALGEALFPRHRKESDGQHHETEDREGEAQEVRGGLVHAVRSHPGASKKTHRARTAGCHGVSPRQEPYTDSESRQTHDN